MTIKNMAHVTLTPEEWDREDEVTEKTMAIMQGVTCGVGDRGKFELRCSLYTDECSAAMWCFHGEDIAKVVEAYGVSDVRRLEGKPCWVDTSDRGMIKWVGPCLIGATD